MNEEALQDAYTLFQQGGYTKSFDEFVTLINTNDEALQDAYTLFTETGYSKGFEDFSTLMGVKKKDAASQLDSGLEMDSTVPTSGTVPQAQPQSGDAASPAQPLTFDVTSQVSDPTVGFETRITPGPMGLPLAEVVQTPEEPNFLTGPFGDMVNSIPIIGDLIDDSFRSVSKGNKRKESIAETHNIITKNGNFNMDDITSYVESVQKYQDQVAEIGKSKEMLEFEAIYAEDPNAWGFVQGIAANPSLLPEVFLESGASMLNQQSGEAFLATLVGGTAGGAAAAGPAGAGVGAVASIPFAFAAAGSQLEIAAAFTELVQEELGDSEFNAENVYNLLNNEEKYGEIVRKSKTKGYTIGAIDAFTAKVGIGAFARLQKQGRRVAAPLVAATTESVGGGVGEVAGSELAGMEYSAADVGFEALAGQTGTPVTIASARMDQMRQRNLDKPSVVLPKNPIGPDTPVYSIDGEQMDKDMFVDMVQKMSPDEIQNMSLSVANDDQTAGLVDDLVRGAEIQRGIDPEIQGEDRARLVALEKERAKYEGSPLRSAKRKLGQIDAKIEAIQNKYDTDPEIAPADQVVPTFGDALDSQATMQDGTKGIIRRDKEYGDRIVFETENQIMDLGNAQDLMDKPVSNLNITAIKSEVTVTPDGEFVVQGDVFSSQSELPTLGIEYDESGNVKNVSVKRANGQPKMFEGDVAEDLAYQILLQQAQTESQVERVNQELDQDEEFQRDHDQYVNRKQKELDGETPGAATPVADEVSEEASVEPEPTPEPIEPRPVEPLEPRPITREELAKLQKEDDLFLPKEGGASVFGVPLSSFKDFGNFVRRKGFSNRAFRTRTLRDHMEKQEGHMSFYNNLVDRTVRKVNKEIKKASKGLTKEEKAQLNQAFDAAVRGDKSQPIPAELMALAVDMRAQIDGLSQQLLDMGAVPDNSAAIERQKKALQESLDKGLISQQEFDAELANLKPLREVIASNIGEYLRVSYRVFDDPKYKPNDFVREKARAHLRGQVEEIAQNLSDRTGEPVEDIINRMVDTRLNDIIAKEQGSASFKRGSKFGSKDIGSLQRKKDINPDIQAFMGLYTDPTLNYARTIQVLSNMVTNAKFLNEVYESGTKNGWMFEANDPNRSQQFSYKMAGDATETLDPLGGMYTTPEIGAALEKTQQQYGPLMRTYRTMVASAKWMKTIASPVTHSVNLFGNIAFAWSNGHFDMSGPNPFKILGADAGLLSDTELTNYFDQLVKRGLIAQSPALNEVKALFKDGNVEALLESRASESNVTARQKVANSISKGKAKPEALYQAEDDVWKVFGANNEINRYAEVYYGKSPDQLTEAELDRVMDVAVENVKNTYANYGRAPELIKSLRFAPLGNFVTFQAEAYRTQYNIFALATAEIAEGKRTNNPRMVKAGTQRAAGAMSYNLFRRSLIEGNALMFGLGLTGIMGDEEKSEKVDQKEADLRRFYPFWSKNSEVYYTNIEPGSFTYIDANAADPFGNINRMRNAFLNGENLQEGLINSLMQGVAPFSDPEMVAQTANNLYNGKKSNGAPLYTEGMTEYQKGEAIIEEVYDLFKPGGITSIETLSKADNKVKTGLLMAIGQRPYKVDVGQQFKFKAYDAGKIIGDSKRIGFDKETNTWTNEENKGVYEEALKKLSDDYMAAVRLGVPSDALIEAMQQARINNDDRYTIRTLN
jgi:hypothetical protein